MDSLRDTEKCCIISLDSAWCCPEDFQCHVETAAPQTACRSEDLRVCLEWVTPFYCLHTSLCHAASGVRKGFKSGKIPLACPALPPLPHPGNTTFLSVSPLSTDQHHKGGWPSALETGKSPQGVCAFSWPPSFNLADCSGVVRNGPPPLGQPLMLSQHPAPDTPSALQKHQGCSALPYCTSLQRKWPTNPIPSTVSPNIPSLA